jgi:AcrR family transcriptional regulator
MNKHELKKQLIIETAFRVWGDCFFYRTSLSSLSDALDMTKPALYRYFKNKDALLQAMRQDFIRKYHLVLGISLPGKYTDIELLLVDSTERAIRFFAENYYYYRFFVLKLLNANQKSNILLEELKGEGEHVLSPDLLKPFNLSTIDAQVLSEYIQLLSGFLLNQRLFSKTLFNESEISKMTKIIRYISLYGLGGHEDSGNSIDYIDIENRSSISIEDVLPYDRIFTAIAEVLAEKGVWKTTLDSVSEHLGMTKSSLYFYFENKDQMIKHVIEREIEQINTLILNRIRRFTTYQEHIYCIFHVMSSYFILKPSIFSIMKWLQFQGDHKPANKEAHKFEKFTEYIEIITKGSNFNPLGFSPELIAEGLNFIVIRELWNCLSNDFNTENINLRLRKIHGLLINGLKGNWK